MHRVGGGVSPAVLLCPRLTSAFHYRALRRGAYDGPPRVRRTHLHAYTCRIYARALCQVSGFEETCLLTRRERLLCDSCSSGQRFAFGFLQIPPYDGHPCRSANSSP
jgi:hypothetical protein